MHVGGSGGATTSDIQLNQISQERGLQGEPPSAHGRLRCMVPKNEADERLIARAVAGEHDAFDVLMLRYMPVIAGFLVGRVSSESDREDLLQETFLTAFAQLGRLRHPARFGPWLVKIARSRLADLRRSEWRRGTPLPADPTNREQPPGCGEVVDTNAKPLADASFGQLRMLIMDALGRMGDKYRTVLYLRLIAGVAPHGIAQQLGLKESTVRMRLMRGLRKLRKTLNKKGLGLSGDQ